MKKLDRYLVEEVMGYFVATSLLFIFIFFMFQSLRLAEFLIVHHVPIPIVAQIAFCLILSFSHLVLPAAFLSAVLGSFSRLSSESELIAMKASGVGTDRLALPVAAVAVGVAIASLALSLELAPWGERTMTKALFTAGGRQAVHSIRAGSFNPGFYGLIIFADEVNNDTGELHRVFLYDARESESPSVVVAERGVIQEMATKSALESRTLLRLFDGSIHHNSIAKKIYERINFQQYSLFLKVDAPEIDAPDIPRMASFTTLRKRIAAAEPGSKSYYDNSTELWKRVSLSLSPIVFAFLGIGLGSFRIRASATAGTLLTLLTALVYWESLIFAVSISNVGKVTPCIGMQLPNLVVAIAAWLAYRKARR